MNDKLKVAEALEAEAAAQREKSYKIYPGNPSMGQVHMELAMALNDIASRLKS